MACWLRRSVLSACARECAASAGVIDICPSKLRVLCTTELCGVKSRINPDRELQARSVRRSQAAFGIDLDILSIKGSDVHLATNEGRSATARKAKRSSWEAARWNRRDA